MKENVIYALGFFDGVHLGHRALLAACRELAQSHGCKAGVVTFDTHPETLVAGQAPGLINSVADRQRLLLGYGMDTVFLLPFDREVQSTHWSAFLSALVAGGAAGFVCGDDFRFGFRGEGNPDLLADFCREKGLHWAIVPGQNLDGQRISSTRIRKLLEEGQLPDANRLLGHLHTLTGTVVSGRGLGHTIGIPTANIQVAPGVLLPKSGVYACEAVVDGQKYPAVTNIGSRPTVQGHHVTVEPWLLDFDGDLYGKELTLLFHGYLREERKFASLEELKAQIQKDADTTRKQLG